MEDFNQAALTWDEQPRRAERAKAVAQRILRIIKNNMDEMNALEYGCGTGTLSFFLQPYLNSITLADNSDGMLGVLQQKIDSCEINNMHPLKLDLAVESLPAQSYDLIYTLMVLHHIVDVDKVLTEFYKGLKPMGYCCIADLDEEDGSFHGEGFTGHNGFNQEKLMDKLRSIGFTNVSSEICYLTARKTDDVERHYPVFFMVGQKV